jgi:hypothetical protein
MVLIQKEGTESAFYNGINIMNELIEVTKRISIESVQNAFMHLRSDYAGYSRFRANGNVYPSRNPTVYEIKSQNDVVDSENQSVSSICSLCHRELAMSGLYLRYRGTTIGCSHLWLKIIGFIHELTPAVIRENMVVQKVMSRPGDSDKFRIDSGSKRFVRNGNLHSSQSRILTTGSIL